MRKLIFILGLVIIMGGCGPSAQDRRKAAEDAERLQQELLDEMAAMEGQVDSVLEAADTVAAADTI